MITTLWIGHVQLQVQHSEYGEIDSVTVLNPSADIFDLLDDAAQSAIDSAMDEAHGTSARYLRHLDNLRKAL